MVLRDGWNYSGKRKLLQSKINPMKIVLLATTSWNLYNSRMSLAKALKLLGQEVILLSPKDEFSNLLIQEGFRWVDFPLKPRGKNIFEEIRSILFLIGLDRKSVV